MPLICSKKLKSLPSNRIFDLQAFMHFHSTTFTASSCNKLTMASWTLLWQQLGQQLQHNGPSTCTLMTMAMHISKISESFRVQGFGSWETWCAWNGYNFWNLGLYRLDMGHAMGWAGGNGHYAGWGRNMPTWHLCKQCNRLWAGGSQVMGRWGCCRYHGCVGGAFVLDTFIGLFNILLSNRTHHLV